MATSMPIDTEMASASSGVSAFTIWIKDTVRRIAARLEKPSDMAKRNPIGSTLRMMKRHSRVGTLSTPAARSKLVATVANAMWIVARLSG